jgi:hypothetical protein
MQYQVFVEQLDEQFTAAVIGLPESRVTGTSRAEALAKLTERLNAWRAEGKLVVLEIRPNGDSRVSTGNPWLDTAGVFKDDPTWDEYQAYIAAYRHELDAEEAARIAAQEATQAATQSAMS